MIATPRVHGAIALPHRRRLLGAALSMAILVAVPASTTAQAPAPTIPARLTDQEFWKFVSDVSEPGGYFRSDNFVSNEMLFQHVIPTLQRTTRPGAIYLGVGPEQNFTYIAALQPRMAVIFDIRRGNLHAHLLYKALFEMAADRAEFISLAFSKPRPAKLDTATTVDSLFNAYYNVETDSVLYRRNVTAVRRQLVDRRGLPLSPADLEGIEYVYYALYWCGAWITYSCTPYGNNGGFGRGNMPAFADLMVQNDGRGVQRSFLSTESTFRWLKDMHARNLIVPVVGNFSGPKAIRAVGQYLKERNATVGAIYVSNVEQYLFQQGDDWRRYYDNVATLPLDSTSTFIRSIGGNMGGGGGGFMRLPSVLSSVQGLLAAYRDGRISGYYDVIQMSR